MSKLRYKNLDISHADALLNIWADADVIKYTNMKLPCTLEDVKNRIEKFKPLDVFVVIQNGELIGIIGCPPVNKEKLQYGLFYQFCKSSWGQGNATIATKWLLDYMKRKYNNATLFADVVVDNVASEKILQKFGFEQLSEELIECDGIIRKVHNYNL
jgi:[ribosomal protein S5]-alanine N-acetyltransferase